jgi:methyltransferase
VRRVYKARPALREGRSTKQDPPYGRAGLQSKTCPTGGVSRTVPTQLAVPAVALLAVLVMMLGELSLSKSNERALLASGAVEVDDEVFRTMRWAYPGVFIAMAAEGAAVGVVLGGVTLVGVSLLVVSKALKFWAIASLGTRWTYRVLVLPTVPLVATGPYRFLRHPNYLAVVGELLAMALMMRARVTGPLGLLFFGWLLFRRITAEERAMGFESGS